MEKINKLLDEAARSNGTGNVKNAITNIIEAIRELQAPPKRTIFTVDLNALTPADASEHIAELKKELNDRKIAFPEPAQVLTPLVQPLVTPSPKMSRAEVVKAIGIKETALNKDGKTRAKPGPKPKVKQTNE